MNKQETNQNPQANNPLQHWRGWRNAPGEAIGLGVRRILIGAVCLILAVGLLTGCGKKGTSQQTNPSSSLHVVQALIVPTGNLQPNPYMTRDGDKYYWTGPLTWTDPNFKVTLPDGLYSVHLYEYYIPVFIVESGKMISPVEQYKKLGKEKYLDRYIRNRTFELFAGNQKLGELNLEQIMEKENQDKLPVIPAKFVTKDFFTLIYSYDYIREKHNPVPNGLYWPVIVPMGAIKPGKLLVEKVTQEDIDKVAKICKEALVPQCYEYVAKTDPYYEVQYRDDNPRIDTLNKVDINGNGIVDYVGRFQIKKYKTYGSTFAFCVMDGNQPQIIDSINMGYSMGTFCGMIDINGDGIYELFNDASLLQKGDVVMRTFPLVSTVWNIDQNSCNRAYFEVIEK